MECSIQGFESVQTINELAATQCAPVIFGIKPSNLLIIDKQYARALKILIESTGLRVRCLDHTSRRQVWLLYRESDLEKALRDTQARDFMERYGYTADMDMEAMLRLVTRRFRQYKRGEIEFPHEMGVFLGYPLGDVKGFIENKGRNCLCSGYWKVYENEQAARETFKLYARVRQMAIEMVSSGMGFAGVGSWQLQLNSVA